MSRSSSKSRVKNLGKIMEPTTANQVPNSIIPVTDQQPVIVPERKSINWILLSLFVLLLLVVGEIWYWKYLENKPMVRLGDEVSSAPIKKVVPTPIPLHAGGETYTISQSKHEGPIFSKITFVPLDVLKGQTLVLTVSISNVGPITSVTGSLNMDSSSSPLLFTQISGSLDKGVWQAKLTLTDSVFYTYTVSVTASGSNGVSTIKVTPR